MVDSVKKTVRKTATKAKTAAKATVKPAEKAETTFAARAREAIEESVEQLTGRAKGAWEGVQERIKTARDSAGGAVGVVRTSLETAGAGVRDVNVKVIDLVAADATRYFETARKVATAKSVKEALEIQAEYIRSQFQTSVANLRTIGEMTTGAARESVKPIVDGVKSLRTV